MTTFATPEPLSLRAIQHQFTRAIRHPDESDAPDGVPVERMAVYQELFTNNFRDAIHQAFPVATAVLDENAWEGMIGDFIAQHHCQSPYFQGIAEAFLGWVIDTRPPHPSDPGWLNELLHYEWVELALVTAMDEVAYPPNQHETIPQPNARLTLSPLAWLFYYRYPVHRIAPQQTVDNPTPQPTPLLVYRDASDDIGFLELNPITARLVEQFHEHPERTIDQQIGAVLDALQLSESPEADTGARQTIHALWQRGVLVPCSGEEQ